MTFDVLPPVDEKGNVRMPPPEFTSDLIRYARRSARFSADVGSGVSYLFVTFSYCSL